MNDKPISSKLQELFDLYKSGAITKLEFETLKKKLILDQKEIYPKESGDGNIYKSIEEKNDESASEKEVEIKQSFSNDDIKKKSRKSLIVKYIIIGIFIALFIFSFILLIRRQFLFTNIQTKAETEESIKDESSIQDVKFERTETSNTNAYDRAKKEVNKVLKEMFNKDYYGVVGTYPDDCSLTSDTIIIIDLNKDNLPDILARYYGEDFEAYGNTTQTGWIVLKNNGNGYIQIPNTLHYQFSISKFENDTLSGTIYSRFDPEVNVKYVFRQNDFELVSEEENNEIYGSNSEPESSVEETFSDDNITTENVIELRRSFIDGINQTNYSSYSKHTYKLDFNAPKIDFTRGFEPQFVNDGIQRAYFENSELVCIQRQLANGQVIEEIQFHPDGRIYNVVSIINGKKNGIVKFVDLENYVILSGQYNDGKLVGYWNTPVLSGFNTQDNRIIEQYPGVVNQMLTLINFYSMDKDTRIFKMN